MLNELTLFLQQLEKHNSKKWMDAHREEWQTLRAEYKEMVTDILEKAVEIDSALLFNTPERALYRINRDIRFSDNKMPYKHWVSTAFWYQGLKLTKKPRYFWKVTSERKLRMAAGVWWPDNSTLKTIRYGICKNPEPLAEFLEKPTITEIYGGLQPHRLSTFPKGFAKEGKSQEYLPFKSFELIWQVDLDENADYADVKRYVLEHIVNTKPFMELIDSYASQDMEVI